MTNIKSAALSLAALQKYPQFVVWRYEEKDDKPTKVPYRADGKGRASTTDNKTWATYPATCDAYTAGGYDGIGFVVTPNDPFTGLDLDHCRHPQTGDIKPWARKIIDQINSYTEITPSDHGIRVYIKATIPPGGNRKGDIEIYDHARYFTITGNHLEGTLSTIKARQDELNTLHASLFPTKPKAKTNGSGHHVSLADTEIIAKAKAAKNGPEFESLMAGYITGYGSHSEADMALCSMLGFWTGNDVTMIDHLFRQSGLYREKWERADYRERTISKACESGDIYDPGNGEAIAASAERYAPEPRPQPTKHNWHDYISDHNTLLNKDLPPMEFVIEDLLPIPGLGILAGKKKIFKSFMGLQISQCVAAGKPFLGLNTRQGLVVYCAPEDRERRLHNRLKMQNAVTGLPIKYLYKLTPLNTPDGIKELSDIITELKPILVIIDTLASAKNGRLNENEARDTSDLFNHIRRIAIENNTTILMVAHHGKKGKNFADDVKDPGFDIRGSSAIPGATDTNIGIYRNGDGTYEFIVEGRDIAEQELRLSFDREITWCWKNEGNAIDLRRSEADDRIISAIDELGGGVDATAIAMQADLTRSTVQKAVKRLRDSGQLVGKLTGKSILYDLPSFTSSTSSTTKQESHYQQMGLKCACVHDGIYPKNTKCLQCGSTEPELYQGVYRCSQCKRYYPNGGK